MLSEKHITARRGHITRYNAMINNASIKNDYNHYSLEQLLNHVIDHHSHYSHIRS